MFFLKHDQRLEVILLFPERSRVNEGHPGCSLLSQAENVKPSNTWRLLHEHCVKAICKELPPLLQTLSKLYKSSGEAEAYGIYIPFWLLFMEHQAVIFYHKFLVPLLN